MGYIFVGLGNPGVEYEGTRHNTGRVVLEYIQRKTNFSDWEYKKRLNGLISEGKIGKGKVIFLLPETFMNKSGASVNKLITSLKKAEKLVVIYDDLDLPLGYFKISYDRNSGGHKGIESIKRCIGTKKFIRVRVGISPHVRGPKKVKKPRGEQKVLDFIMGKFRKQETLLLRQVSSRIHKVIEVIVREGKSRAMNEFN